MSIDIHVPALGESVSDATIARWIKKVGESVTADEPIVELETDKVTLEVPSPVGRLDELLRRRRYYSVDLILVGLLRAVLLCRLSQKKKKKIR